MLTFDQGNKRFNYRVATVIIQNEAVLLQGSYIFDFWVLPGGRAEMGEPAAESARRELEEELGVQAEVGRLLWMLENFFEHDGYIYHEISMIFHATVPTSLYQEGVWKAVEPEITFKWQPLATLTEDLDMYPLVIREALLKPLPEHPIHIVESEM